MRAETVKRTPNPKKALNAKCGNRARDSKCVLDAEGEGVEHGDARVQPERRVGVGTQRPVVGQVPERSELVAEHLLGPAAVRIPRVLRVAVYGE